MKIKAVAVIFLVALSILPTFVAYSDGFTVHRRTLDSSWELSTEEEQVCFITHQGGVQRMLLSVDLSSGSDELMWIFPVPSEPENVSISVTLGLPTFKGVNIDGTALKVIKLALAMARNTVFIPLPDDFPQPSRRYSMGFDTISRPSISQEEITVYQTVDRLGITSILLSAKSSEALEGFLDGYGVELPSETLPVVDDYIGEEYCFVVSWVNDPSYSNLGKKLALTLTFPTERPFFPLKLTSVYGDQMIPVTIYIWGHKAPNLYSGIAWRSDVDYFTRASLSYPFPNVETQYTRVTVNSPSSSFSEDLWFDNGMVWTGRIANLILENQFVVWNLVGVLLFGVASLLASITVLGYNIPKAKFFLLGVFNFFTVLVLALGYLLVTARRQGDEVMAAPVYTGGLMSDGDRMPIKGMVFDVRVIAYLFLFVVLMLFLSMVLEFTMTMLL